MIKADKINFSYGNLKVLKELDLHIKKGEFVSIVGASGSGKTTLLQLLGTLENTDSGEIIIDEKSVQKLSEKELAIFRNQKIGFVFQFHNLLAEFSALENVCLPAYIAGISKKQAEKKAKEILSILGLENRMTHKPGELSGGEQQRVAIARALCLNPEILLLDEITSALDPELVKEVLDTIRVLASEGMTLLIVSHEMVFVKELSNKVVFMDEGAIVDFDTPQNIFESPKHFRIADFVSKILK